MLKLKKGLTKKELEDILAFTELSLLAGKKADYIFENVVHDLVGIGQKQNCFVPRTDRYKKILELKLTPLKKEV